ncbi:SMR family transporter [Chelatococcus sambhunathii]|nr:SMR family transporter [Chelatococcus sambhunathii]
MPLGSAYLLLGLVTVAEVVATSALKTSEGFARLGPGLVTTAS